MDCACVFRKCVTMLSICVIRSGLVEPHVCGLTGGRLCLCFGGRLQHLREAASGRSAALCSARFPFEHGGAAGYRSRADCQAMESDRGAPGTSPNDGHELSALTEPRVRRISRLCSRDERERAEALRELARTGRRETLLQLLRVSRTCPLEDVRRGATELLGAAQAAGVEVPRELVSGPSTFIPDEEVLEDVVGQHDLVEAFLSMGRVDHVVTVMTLHPTYLSCFLHTQQALLQHDGPLPQPWRHYIVVMAAARHRCSYLVHLHSSWFLEMGGQESWLGGIHSAPPKLRRLNLLNKLLAHRPWLITRGHVEELVSPGSEERWSLAELIQAVILLTYAHSLSSFVWGCGINPELDLPGGHTFRPPSPGRPHSPVPKAPGDRQGGSDQDSEVQRLMEKMQLLLEQEGQFSQEDMVRRFEEERSETLLEAPCDDAQFVSPDVSRFVEDPEFAYQDFAPRGEQAPPTLRAQDYSWEDHGFSLMNRLYPDMGQLLDEKFQVVLGLTYHTMAMHRDVDTSMLRKAVWNYIHCLFGIRYDDYDYGDVNQLLELNLKVYIKTVACHPEKTTHRMYSNFWKHFRHSEKVHINLLLLEARLQAALLYALRAITRYMT